MKIILIFLSFILFFSCVVKAQNINTTHVNQHHIHTDYEDSYETVQCYLVLPNDDGFVTEQCYSDIDNDDMSINQYIDKDDDKMNDNKLSIDIDDNNIDIDNELLQLSDSEDITDADLDVSQAARGARRGGAARRGDRFGGWYGYPPYPPYYFPPYPYFPPFYRPPFYPYPYPTPYGPYGGYYGPWWRRGGRGGRGGRRARGARAPARRATRR